MGHPYVFFPIGLIPLLLPPRVYQSRNYNGLSGDRMTRNDARPMADVLQVRYRQSSSSNNQGFPLQGTAGLRATDGAQRGRVGVIQGSDAPAGRVDGDGFCVRFTLVEVYCV